jgi:hypothetical protein
MNTPNRPKSRTGLKAAIAAGAIAGTVSWCGAEPLANYLIQEPVVPQTPTKPEPEPAKRKPIEIAIGIDISRSSIASVLPEVTAVTSEFLSKTSVLQDGDTVKICPFTENASCKEYKMMAGRSAMVTDVSAIKAEPPRKHMETHVHNSIKQITSQVKGQSAGPCSSADRCTMEELHPQATSMVTVWTDAVEDDKSPKYHLPDGHAPVTIVVPREKYLDDAENVRQTLGLKNVTVLLAADSKTFGQHLEKGATALTAEANKKAKEEADQKYQQAMLQYGTRLSEHQKELNAVKAKRAARLQTISTTKHVFESIGGTLLALAAGVTGTILYLRNRPVMRGHILDLTGEYPEIHHIPPDPKETSLRQINSALPSHVILRPAKDGIYLGDVRIKNGQEIENNIYWFEEEPTEDQISARQARQRVKPQATSKNQVASVPGQLAARPQPAASSQPAASTQQQAAKPRPAALPQPAAKPNQEASPLSGGSKTQWGSGKKSYLK